MKKIHYHILLLLAVMFATASCSDHLFDDLINNGEEDLDGMAFTVSTVEMADLTVNMGGTRAASFENSEVSEETANSDAFIAHPLTGDNPYGLQVHRMPLPYVGIHRKAVNARCLRSSDDAADSESSEHSESSDLSTRAPVAAIVHLDASNFHDSLTIWGYTNEVYKNMGTGSTDDDNKTIFSQTLLKKIRNWRSSAQWPYGNTLFGKPTKMRFYAVAPAFESIDIQLGNTPSFNSPPVFTYTLPETAGEMRDLLYGKSDEVDVQVGPTGSTEGDPKAENLGKDNKFVDLSFQHILTYIRFAKGTIPDGITIQQINIEGVGTSATFTPSATDAATATLGAWSAPSGSATYTLWPKGVTSTSGSNVYIDGDSCFFMIPQTLSSSAKLTVTLSAPQHYAVDDNGVYTPYDGERTSASSGSSRTHTLSCSLSGDIWKKGYTVTYKLTVGEVEDGYYLIAENPEAYEHSNYPINGTFPIHSYRSYFDYSDPAHPDGKEVKTHAVNWEVVGYSTKSAVENEDNAFKLENKPAWLHGTTPNTTGIYEGGYDAIASYSIDAQSYTKIGNHQTILNVNGNSASGLPSDLSTNGTANSYIVNRIGSFEFPLVYGNKVTDGAEESWFVDHKGATISHHKIEDQIKAKNPADGIYEDIVADVTRKRTEYTWNAAVGDNQTLRSIVVWQDELGLVTPSITSEKISFSVNKAKQGNAVIALQGRTRTTYQKKSEGEWGVDTSQGTNGYDYGPWETFWTWHIWMTDEVYANEGTINTPSAGTVSINTQYLNWSGTDHLVTLQNKTDNVEKKILPVNLGWVSDRSTFLVDAVEYDFGFYDHREVWVKLKQVEPTTGAQSTIVKIEQHARQPLVTGTGTVYQWGRPTAFPSVFTIKNAKRTIYDGAGNDITDQFQIAVQTNASDAISQPLQILRYSNSEEDNSAWFNVNDDHAYWSADTKTVYDPCPPGFQMPSYTIFTGMSRTGVNELNGTSLNIYPDVDGQVSAENQKGGYFYRIKYTKDDALNTNRYTLPETTQSTLFYMPATGEYQGDLPVGTLMSSSSNSHINTASGIYWTGDHTQDNSKMGTALWFYPAWSYTGENINGKRAIDFGRTVKYSSLLPIRPVEQ